MIVLIRILLLLLPIIGVIYFLRWRYRVKASGEDPNDEDIKNVRAIMITVLVSIIMLGLLLRFADTSSSDRETTYIPPHMVDGELVPGEFVDSEEAGKPVDSPETSEPQDQE